jgi:hypothetical protein
MLENEVMEMENDLQFINKSFEKLQLYIEKLDAFRKALTQLQKQKSLIGSFVADLKNMCNHNAKTGKYGVTEEVTWSQVSIFLKSNYLQYDQYKIIPNCLELLEHYKTNLDVVSAIWETQTRNSPKSRGVSKTYGKE